MAQKLTKQAAVEIAKAHGLKAADAVALVQLADTVDEAESYAATFAVGDDSSAIAEHALGGRS